MPNRPESEERPVEGVDPVGEAALLAHLVPKPRGEAAAEHLGEHVGRVVARVLERAARQAEDDVGLFEPARGGAVRRRCRRPARLAGLRRRESRRTALGAGHHGLVLDRAGRREHHALGRVFARHEGADRLRRRSC